MAPCGSIRDSLPQLTNSPIHQLPRSSLVVPLGQPPDVWPLAEKWCEVAPRQGRRRTARGIFDQHAQTADLTAPLARPVSRLLTVERDTQLVAGPADEHSCDDRRSGGRLERERDDPSALHVRRTRHAQPFLE